MERVKEITIPLLEMLDDSIYKYSQLAIAVPFLELPKIFVKYYTLQRNMVYFIEDTTLNMKDVININTLLKMKKEFIEIMRVLLEESEFDENCYLETSYEVKDMYNTIESLVTLKLR